MSERVRRALHFNVLLGALAACADEDLSPNEVVPAASGGSSAGGESADSSGAAGHAGVSPVYPPPIEPDAVRVVVLGDAGTGSADQFKVGQAMGAVCASHGGCSLALYLGDNIYPVGVSSTADPQLQTKFEDVYADLDFPFQVLLGNHDYGGGFDLARAQAQVDYSAFSSKWSMPGRYYSFSLVGVSPGSSPLVEFFMLDTQHLVVTGDPEQTAWAESAMAASSARWKIAAGHHPYKSNGSHGNAGQFDNVSGNGVAFQTLVQSSMCDRIDLYLGAHDHNRQWLAPECGVEFTVSGAGATVRSLPGDNPTLFENSEDLGFLFLQLSERRILGTFYDADGFPQFTRAIEKTR